MEQARLSKSDNVVFSYRNQADSEAGDLFDRDFGWFRFMEQSIKLSTEFEFVVACDISEFYPRLGHLSYAMRVLAHTNNPDNQALLQQLYEERTSPLVRRDIILVLAKWGEWYWLSDRKNRFRELSGPERRAFIVASYILRDEGDHWRRHIAKELNPFERFIMSWAGRRASNPNWAIPL